MDDRRIAEAAATEIEACLYFPQGTPPDLQGEYSVLKQWYQHMTGSQPHPSHNDLEKVSGYYAYLYQWEDPSPPGRPVTTHISQFYIDDNTPSEL